MNVLIGHVATRTFLDPSRLRPERTEIKQCVQVPGAAAAAAGGGGGARISAGREKSMSRVAERDRDTMIDVCVLHTRVFCVYGFKDGNGDDKMYFQ
jgi:hypothetical protein